MKTLYLLPVLMTALGVNAAAQKPAEQKPAEQKAAAQKQAERRLPYTAIHDPEFIPASSATFLHHADRVIGVMSGPVAKAYPAAILSQHGLVEDQSPSGPIAITW